MNNIRLDLIRPITLSTIHEFEVSYKNEIDDFYKFYSKLKDKTQINVNLEITKEDENWNPIEYVIIVNPNNKKVLLSEMMVLEYIFFSNISWELIEILQERVRDEKQVEEIIENIEKEAKKILNLYVN